MYNIDLDMLPVYQIPEGIPEGDVLGIPEGDVLENFPN